MARKHIFTVRDTIGVNGHKIHYVLKKDSDGDVTAVNMYCHCCDKMVSPWTNTLTKMNSTQLQILQKLLLHEFIESDCSQ